MAASLDCPEHFRDPKIVGSFSEALWCTVELQPDVFVPQSFSVGVVVQPSEDSLRFRLLDDYQYLEYIYGDSFPPRDIRMIMAHASRTLRRAASRQIPIQAVSFDSFTLRLSPGFHTSGDHVEATVDRLFEEVVVMAPKIRHGRSDTAAPPSPE
ncbi:hypothetical protein [Caballeronia sp. LZ035]|uniref:hypothetical protein n=1 Tax=Caballeronia sp. LZ035 TaxID=3038568 RepID=UPI00285A917B|nr:hypothetical protein [Caballeronia sp. LZ035]MDR5761181.1 hypothetical protein [Caballeronia sp. LZ035]